MQNETYLNALQKTIDFVWDNQYCDFYKTFWTSKGVTKKPILHSLEDFIKIPATQKEDFELYPTPDERLFVPRDKIVSLTSTSGSTRGTPFFVWRNDFGTEFYRSLVGYGATRALMIRSTHSSSAIMASQLTLIGLPTVLVDPHQMQIGSEIMTAKTFDTLFSSPSVILQFAKFITDDAQRASINHILLCDEDCSIATKELILQHFPNAGLYNELSAAEARGPLLFKKPTCDGPHSLVHVNTDDTFVDIDKDSLIHFTNINRMYTTPTVRYQSGDRGIWSAEECTCGDISPRIQLIGRADVDFVRIHEMEIRVNLIDECLKQYSRHITPIIKATVKEIVAHNNTVVKLTVGIQKSSTSEMLDELLANEIISSLLDMKVSANLTVRKAMEMNMLCSPEVKFLDVGPTKNKNKTIKLVTD